MKVAQCLCELWFDIISDQYTRKGVLHGFVGVFLSLFCEALPYRQNSMGLGGRLHGYPLLP